MTRRNRWGWAVLACLGLLSISALSWVTEGTDKTAARRPQIEAAYGKLSLTFEANQGHIDAQVKYLSRGRGYTLFLTPTEAVVQLRHAHADDRNPDCTGNHRRS